MIIDYLAYILYTSEGEGSNHSLTTAYWMGKILPKLRNKKIEHLNWVGIEDNAFTEEPTPYALIFYSEDWNSAAIVDRLILDIQDPYSDDANFPSPFERKYTAVKGNRKKFINLLKGENIF